MNAIADASTIDPSQAIGQIAVQLPGATAVFRRLKLDFCCGGHVSLDQAASDKGLDLQAVVHELSALQRPSELPDLGTPTELVEHIIARYHEVHRAQLPELIRMARRVEAVHRDNPNTPHGLADALETMEQELLMHMHKEEAVLSNDITPPMGACNTWRALYTGLAQLREDLINHIHLENNILFPQFEQAAQPQGCGGGGCGCA